MAYAPGESGQAFDFNASNRSVFVPDSPDFVLTNAFTVEGWFNARHTTAAVVALRGDNTGAGKSWIVQMLNTGEFAFQIDQDRTNSVRIKTPVETGQWNHFAATFDSASGGMKLYLN